MHSVTTVTKESIGFSFVDSSTDPLLLEQYYALRQDIYTSYWNLNSFSGCEDSYDKKGHILLIHKNGICLGGARLIVHRPKETFFLPMENKEFQLDKLLPELMLKKNAYAELSKVVLVPELMNGQFSSEIYKHIGTKGRELNVRYVFAVAPFIQARRSKIACQRLGMKTEIRKDIDVLDQPTFEKIKMYLSVVHLGQ